MTNENIESLLKELGMPQMFGYNSLVCWCTDIKRGGESATFLGKFSKPDGNISIEQYMETIPYDMFFRILVAAYYGISATSVSVQLLIDEDHGSDALTIQVYGSWSKNYIAALNNAAFLFVGNAARGSNILARSTVADTVRNIEVADASGTMQSIDVECVIDSDVRKSYAMPDSHWFRMPYGISCSFSCSNYSEIDKAVKGYMVSSCQRVLYRCTEEISKRIQDLRSRLDPDGIFDIGFKTRPAIMAVTPQSIDVAVVAEPTFVRQFEVNDCHQLGILTRPCGSSIRLPHSDSIDHDVGGTMVARLGTELLSTPGNLYVPRAINRAYRWDNGFEYIECQYEPHIASFSSPALYPFPENSQLRPNLDEYWMPFDILPGKIQGIVPMNITPSDPEVLLYGRIDRDFLATAEGRTKTKATLCSRELRPYTVWTDGSWRYFALVDETQCLDSGCPELYGDPVYVPFEFIGNSNDDSFAVLLNIIYGLMSSDNIDDGLDHLGKELYDTAMENAPSEQVALVGIWAANVHMIERDRKLFHAYYRALRQAMDSKQLTDHLKVQTIKDAIDTADGEPPKDMPRETIDLTNDGPTATEEENPEPEKKPNFLKEFFRGILDGLRDN